MGRARGLGHPTRDHGRHPLHPRAPRSWLTDRARAGRDPAEDRGRDRGRIVWPLRSVAAGSRRMRVLRLPPLVPDRARGARRPRLDRARGGSVSAARSSTPEDQLDLDFAVEPRVIATRATAEAPIVGGISRGEGSADDSPSDEQRAVIAFETDLVVTAGAGSGKTRTLVDLYTRILD